MARDDFPSLLTGCLCRAGLCWVCGLLLSFATANAQIVFSASDLPSQPGAYYRAYANVAEVDVSGRIGLPGGPRRWDFSQPKGATETVQRMDVVLPSDGGNAASFATAAYAERITRESDGSRSWSYYRIVPALGRSYFGFFDPVANSAKPLIVFDAPTTDLPARIEFGQSWNRSVDWEDLLDAGFFQIRVAVHFTSRAEVDAYGTIVLPSIGEVPALRVNEVNTYEFQDLSLGLPLPPQIFRNYFFLVRGIGKAVHIVSNGQATVPSENFSPAKTVLRVFEASDVKDRQALRSVTGLRIRVEKSQVLLDWLSDSAASRYRIETVADVAATPWRVLAEPSTNSWSEAIIMSDSQKYFRVFAKP